METNYSLPTEALVEAPAPAPAQVNLVETSESARREKEKLAAELAQFQAMARTARAALRPEASLSERAQQVMDVAQQLFAAAPTWISFYRELLSLTGVARYLYTTAQEFRWFERTEQYYELQKMITVLRARGLPENDPSESQRMVTVRMPSSMHLALCREAEERGTSINQLCISRLMQMVNDELIPQQSKGRRGRRPGPQGPRKSRVETETTTPISEFNA